MSDSKEQDNGSGAEQPVRFGAEFAPVLKSGGRVALTLLFLSYGVYVAFQDAAKVSPREMTQLWTLPTKAFVSRTGFPVGWVWVQQLRYSDVAPLGALYIVGLIMPLTLLWLAFRFLRRRRVFFFLVAVLQTMILACAAAGLLTLP